MHAASSRGWWPGRDDCRCPPRTGAGLPAAAIEPTPTGISARSLLSGRFGRRSQRPARPASRWSEPPRSSGGTGRTRTSSNCCSPGVSSSARTGRQYRRGPAHDRAGGSAQPAVGAGSRAGSIFQDLGFAAPSCRVEGTSGRVSRSFRPAARTAYPTSCFCAVSTMRKSTRRTIGPSSSPPTAYPPSSHRNTSTHNNDPDETDTTDDPEQPGIG
jgi:hypothetical protein